MKKTEFYSPERRAERLKWYNSAEWRKRREKQLKKFPLCALCELGTPKKFVLATVADHIDPVIETKGEWRRGKLQSLCAEHNRWKSAFYDIPFQARKKRTTLEVKDV